MKAFFLIIFAIAIFLTAIILIGNYRYHQMIRKETTAILSTVSHTTQRSVLEKDILNLPVPVKIWLRNSGMIGKPYIRVAKVIQQAEMKMKPEQQDWTSAYAQQYTTVEVPAFIWTVKMRMNPLAHVRGRDKYVDGSGEMLIKLNSLINVVNERGEKLNEGTLQRYLGEMVWFPSLALSPYITWEHINDRAARATMEFQGVSGSGTFYFDEGGNFIRFVALRYMGNDESSQRFEWVLDVESYKVFDGIKVPSRMTATWRLKDQNWTWLKLEIRDIMYNEEVRLK